MAEVKEIKSEGLVRNFAVSVSPEEVEKKFLEKLEGIGKKVKVPGFRPGKVPLPVLRQRFGAEAREKAIDDLLKSNVWSAIKERDLRPALSPQIQEAKETDNGGLDFKFNVEVLPEISPVDFSKINLERLVVEITESMIDKAIENLARAKRKPEVIEEKRPAQKGDIAVIDFRGTVEGKPLPGMKADGFWLELGSNSFIEGFEEKLIGLSAEESKKFSITFPKDYHADHLAGKEAEFEVSIKELRAHKPVVINDELAKEIGFASLQEMRDSVSKNLKAYYEKASRSLLKQNLMDELAKAVSFPVPPGMLEEEFKAIWQQIERERKLGKIDREDEGKTEDELKNEYREIAERRLRLGLLFADIAKRHNIKVTHGDMQKAVMEKASNFPGQEHAVISYYMKDKENLEQMYAPALEEKVVDFILSQAKITEKQITAEDLAKQEPLSD